MGYSMNPLILGLGYEQRCGKGEVAKLAVALGAKHLSFGYSLKNEIMEWLTKHGVSFDRANFYGSSIDKAAILHMNVHILAATELSGLIKATDCETMGNTCYFSARRLMQYYGTEYRRNQDPEYWRHQTEADMCDLIVQGRRFIVFDDVRFFNEADVVKSNGGVMVRIDRKDRPGAMAEGHASDTEMAKYQGWDCVIGNNGTLEDLADKFNHFIVPHLMERGILPWEEPSARS